MQTEVRLQGELQSRPFGRKSVATAIIIAPQTRLADDFRLFALTFAGGFLFVMVYLA